MGIKSIKSVENNLKPHPIFDIENMIKVRSEPIANSYKFTKKIGAGTYGEVFLATHEKTGNARAIKKISTLKFPRIKTSTINEISLMKSLVSVLLPRITPTS